MVGSKAVMIAVAALGVWLARRYFLLLDLGKEVPQRGSQCHLLSATLSGEHLLSVEDLVEFRPGVLIGGAGDTFTCMHETPENASPGYMIAVDVRNGTPAVFKLNISGTPLPRFQPHGIFYSNLTNRLYAVNHGGETGIGTRVEMFSVQEDEKGLPRLEWIMSIGGGNRFPSISLNSVVEGRGDEIYITQFQNAPMPKRGEKHPETLKEKLGRALDVGLAFAAVGGFTGVHHCSFDVLRKETIQCHMVVRGFVHANGLTINNARSKLWVNDPVRRSIHVFRKEDSGDLIEIPEEHIYLPHVVDNIHYDTLSGHLFAGSLPYMYEQLDEKKLKRGTFLDISPPLESNKSASFADLLVHDGHLLSQFSTCHKVSANSTSWGICGSPGGEGLLSCPL